MWDNHKVLYLPHIPMNIAKNTVAVLSNRYDCWNTFQKIVCQNLSSTFIIGVTLKRHPPMMNYTSSWASSSHIFYHREDTWWSARRWSHCKSPYCSKKQQKTCLHFFKCKLNVLCWEVSVMKWSICMLHYRNFQICPGGPLFPHILYVSLIDTPNSSLVVSTKEPISWIRCVRWCQFTQRSESFKVLKGVGDQTTHCDAKNHEGAKCPPKYLSKSFILKGPLKRAVMSTSAWNDSLI